MKAEPSRSGTAGAMITSPVRCRLLTLAMSGIATRSLSRIVAVAEKSSSIGAAGPVRTSARVLGDEPDAPVEVLLTDRSLGQVTTHVYARAVPVPDT